MENEWRIFQLSIDVLSAWCCIPDSTKQNLRAHRYATTTNVQNLSLITLMRRICSFHGFLYLDYFFIWICMRLSGAGIFTDYHLLGTVFQTDQLFCGLVVLWFSCIEGRFGWKPIPSEASVESDKAVFEKKTLSGDTNTDSTD